MRSFAVRAFIGTTVAAATIALLLLVWLARGVLLLVFTGVLVGVFFRRLAGLVAERTGMRTGVALAIVVLTLVGGLLGAFVISGPSIGEEIGTLREQLPQAAEQVKTKLEQTALGKQLISDAEQAVQSTRQEGGVIARATGILSMTLGALASVLLVLVLSIMFAASPRVYVNGLLALLPTSRVKRGEEVLTTIADTLWWWLLGRFVAIMVVLVATWIGLAVLGVPLAMILALIAGLLSFIPNLGPILAWVPAALLAFVQGSRTVLAVTILYVAIQIVDNYFLGPFIDRRTIYLPPAVTIIMQLVLGVVTGLLGVALAAPITATVIVLITMLYVQDVLGRTEVQVGAKASAEE